VDDLQRHSATQPDDRQQSNGKQPSLTEHDTEHDTEHSRASGRDPHDTEHDTGYDTEHHTDYDTKHSGAGGRSPDDIAHVLELEAALLDPAVREDVVQLDALLHPDFVELGASGRIWTRQAILDALPLEGDVAPRATASGLVGHFIDNATILVTYQTTSTTKTAVRSSVWVRSNGGNWHIRFHQGTPLDD
jgi:hypothetical protein